MSTQARRLDRLEQALTPLEAVLAWLDEAHEYPDFEAYVRMTIDLDPAQMSLPRILARVQAAANDRHHDETALARARRVRTAIRDAVFVYMLAIEIDSTVARFATGHAVGLAFSNHMMVEYLDCLLLERHTALPDILEIYGDTVEQLRPRLSELVRSAVAERTARQMLIDRYLDGRSPLFDETVEAWDRLERLVEVATGSITEAARGRSPSDEASVSASIDERARTRAREMFDDARVSAFEYLGERDAAREIIRARLMRPRPDDG